MGETVLVSKSGLLPIYDIKLKKETTSKLTKERSLVTYNVKLDLTGINHLFCSISFPESSPYIEEHYQEIKEKEEVLSLVQKTLDTLKEYGATVPDIVKWWREDKGEQFDEILLRGSLSDLEDTFTKDKGHIGRYMSVVHAVAQLSIAFSKGDLVPSHNEYAAGELFECALTSLLYECIYSLF